MESWDDTIVKFTKSSIRKVTIEHQCRTVTQPWTFCEERTKALQQCFFGTKNQCRMVLSARKRPGAGEKANTLRQIYEVSGDVRNPVKTGLTVDEEVRFEPVSSRSKVELMDLKAAEITPVAGSNPGWRFGLVFGLGIGFSEGKKNPVTHMPCKNFACQRWWLTLLRRRCQTRIDFPELLKGKMGLRRNIISLEHLVLLFLSI